MELAVLIPIFAMSIPIVAIISAGLTKRAKLKAQTGNSQHVQVLERRVEELEQQVHSLSHTMLELEQQQGFITRVLEEDAGKKTR
jgi:TolA-binding protein